MSDSVQPHRWQPTRLHRPWDSPGKNTGVGCHFLLQCMKVKSESEVAQSCPTLRDPKDCSLPGSSFHGIFQATTMRRRLSLNTSFRFGSTPFPFCLQTDSSSSGPQSSPGCKGSPTHQTPKRCSAVSEGPRAKPRGRFFRARMARVCPGGTSLSPGAQSFLGGLHPDSGPRRGSGAAGREEAAQEVVGVPKRGVRKETRGPARS